MAIRITEECINCGACEPECPAEAIGEGEITYIIDPKLCTECYGIYDYHACQAVCPVECCLPDPRRVESKNVLAARSERLGLTGKRSAQKDLPPPPKIDQNGCGVDGYETPESIALMCGFPSRDWGTSACMRVQSPPELVERCRELKGLYAVSLQRRTHQTRLNILRERHRFLQAALRRERYQRKSKR